MIFLPFFISSDRCDRGGYRPSSTPTFKSRLWGAFGFVGTITLFLASIGAVPLFGILAGAACRAVGCHPLAIGICGVVVGFITAMLGYIALAAFIRWTVHKGLDAEKWS